MSQRVLFVTKFYWPLCHILSQNSQNVITCHRISGKQVLSQKVTMSQGITSLLLVYWCICSIFFQMHQIQHNIRTFDTPRWYDKKEGVFSSFFLCFQHRCKKGEKQTIKFSSDNAEVYNKPFSMEELRDALHRAHDTSAGPDEIHYQLLKHLPDASLLRLLNIFNKIWISGDFPSDWRKAIIIPIPKPGKDPTNYRPIALTSCICKTMERMINRRLVWYLESNKLLTNVECSFRSRRSTVDHLVRFETFCREA